MTFSSTQTPHLQVAAATTATVVAVTAAHYCYSYTSRQMALRASVGQHVTTQFMALLRKPWTRPILLRAPENEPKTSPQEGEEEQESPPLKALLVILPDDTVRSEAYLPLARLLQEKAIEQGVQLHVGIARFFWNRPQWIGDADAQANIAKLTQQASALTQQGPSRSKQKRQGRIDHVFLWGHGKGTETVLSTAPHAGLIRFGSVDGMPSSLAQYVKPCLTLLGDRDGHVPSVRLAALLDDLDRYGTAPYNAPDDDVPVPKPVLLLPGVNHVCVVEDSTRGTTTTSYLQNDLPLRTGITPALALDQVACVSVNFVRIVLNGKRDENNELQRLTERTRRDLEPYRDLVRPQRVADFCRNVQKVIYAHPDRTRTDANDFVMPCAVPVHVVTALSDFAFSKPQLGDSFVRVFVYDQGPLRDEKNKMILWSGTWAIKCRSQASLRFAFENDRSGLDDGPTDFPDVFREINRQTFDYVLNHVVTKEEKDRYLQEGLPLAFGPDVERLSTVPRDRFAWISSDLLLTHHADDGWTVATPSAYTTSSEKLPAKFRGMHYGKILSPAQCYEWIVSGCWRMAAGI